MTNVASTESTALFQPPKPGDVLLTKGALDSFIKDVIQPEIDKFEFDLTTKKGRDAVKSFAFKVTRTGTFLDNLGKELNVDARKQINIVDEARRYALAKLHKVRDDFRKPLDEWEAAEQTRMNNLIGIFDYLLKACVMLATDTAASVEKRIAELRSYVLDESILQDQTAEAAELRDTAIGTLIAQIDRLKQAEADAAELATLRAAQAERDRQDAERKTEEEHITAAAEKQRQQEERAKRQNDEAAALAEQRLIAERQRMADEQAARTADVKHREEVIEAAIKALIAFTKLSEDQARNVLLAIYGHQIPYVTIKF